MIQKHAALLVGWANSVCTLAAFSFKLSFSEVLTVLFVTIPVGIWSWFRLIDYLKQRKGAKTP